MTRIIPVADRFEEKYIPEPNTGCFIWTGSLDPSGYGRIIFKGRNWKASRIAWLIANGDPGDLFICHRCDNPCCVNIDHLFLGTRSDNAKDMTAKGRNPQAKLNTAKVRELRALRAAGATYKALAERFGVDRNTIYSSMPGKRAWTHVR